MSTVDTSVVVPNSNASFTNKRASRDGRPSSRLPMTSVFGNSASTRRSIPGGVITKPGSLLNKFTMAPPHPLDMRSASNDQEQQFQRRNEPNKTTGRMIEADKLRRQRHSSCYFI